MNKNKINYRKANRELLKVKEYMEKELDPVLSEERNLKLYDVYFQAADIIDKYQLVKEKYMVDDLFYLFCEDQYDCFKDDMKHKGIDINELMKYIGRTSSFYISEYYNIYDIETLYDLVNNGYREVQFSADGMQVKPFINEYMTYSDNIDSDIYDLEYIISGKFLRDVKEYFLDSLKLAEYIDNFMKNQISIFTEFIEYQNELIVDQEMQEKERQEKEKEDFIII